VAVLVKWLPKAVLYFFTDVVFKHTLDTTNHPSILNKDRAELQKYFDDSIPALLGARIEELNKNGTLARLDIEKVGSVDLL
jgi:hypothetical protein